MCDMYYYYCTVQYVHRRHWVRSPPCTGRTMPAHDDPAESSDRARE
jgi:hypothetical protein